MVCRLLPVRIRHAATVLALGALSIVSAYAAGGRNAISNHDLKEWLTYIASDELAGRAVYGQGIGLAASYIENHLRAWGVKPAGDTGSYLQTVKVLGIRVTNHSTLTVEVGGQTRTFTHGDGITFPREAGGKRRFSVDRVQFAGYGLDVPSAHHEDFRGLDVTGAAVIWLGTREPKGVDPSYRRLLNGRHRYAIDQLKAVASIGPESGLRGRGGRGGQPRADAAPPPDSLNEPSRAAAGAVAPPPPGAGAGGGRGELPTPDFTTVQRLDTPRPPGVSAADAFFEFLFSRAPTRYAELKRMADAQEPLPTFVLADAKLTFNIDADYEIVRTQLTQNVVAIVEGSDAQLKNTYVAFGAHYDHVGYAEGEIVQGTNGPRRLGAPGRVKEGAIDDRIWNGADDDGSGTVSLMAIAKAFAEGPRPKRSLLFVWHAGEERGLLGSRYYVDHPTVPLDRIVTELNVDMIGRNREDKLAEANTVYPVGSDRISTELHRILEAANTAAPKPLMLDYEMNDPADLEQVYYRSDHYSYAAKGIPIIFFTTGLHSDYHANTDEVSKIEFDKMTRIAQLVYDTGARVANLDHPPARDNRGPRAGRATTIADR